METIRAFVAVPLNTKTIKLISGLQETLKKNEADIKWVQPENMHLTLIFLGEVLEEQLTDYYRILENCSLKIPRFNLNFQGLGAFPALKRPRVLWVGVKKGKDEMAQLAYMVRTSLGQASLLNEKELNQKYSAHLTLGRVRSQERLPELIGNIYGNQSFCTEPVKVNQFHFIKSQLTRSGPIYSVLRKFYLK